MPRPTWKGFLRLSLVSCPISLIPAATKARSIRLHQVRVPRNQPEAEPAEPRRNPQSCAAPTEEGVRPAKILLRVWDPLLAS
jgi:hypothetical protein